MAKQHRARYRNRNPTPTPIQTRIGRIGLIGLIGHPPYSYSYSYSYSTHHSVRERVPLRCVRVRFRAELELVRKGSRVPNQAFPSGSGEFPAGAQRARWLFRPADGGGDRSCPWYLSLGGGFRWNAFSAE